MKVFDPKGDMFEVTPELAKKLTLQDGWTFSAKPAPLFKPESPLATHMKPEAELKKLHDTVPGKTTTFLPPKAPAETTLVKPKVADKAV